MCWKCDEEGQFECASCFDEICLHSEQRLGDPALAMAVGGGVFLCEDCFEDQFGDDKLVEDVCDTCEGVGEFDQPCKACDGRGYHPYPPPRYNITCHACNGQGFKMQDCPGCGGKGVVKVPKQEFCYGQTDSMGGTAG